MPANSRSHTVGEVPAPAPCSSQKRALATDDELNSQKRRRCDKPGHPSLIYSQLANNFTQAVDSETEASTFQASSSVPPKFHCIPSHVPDLQQIDAEEEEWTQIFDVCEEEIRSSSTICGNKVGRTPSIENIVTYGSLQDTGHAEEMVFEDDVGMTEAAMLQLNFSDTIMAMENDARSMQNCATHDALEAMEPAPGFRNGSLHPEDELFALGPSEEQDLVQLLDRTTATTSALGSSASGGTINGWSSLPNGLISSGPCMDASVNHSREPTPPSTIGCVNEDDGMRCWAEMTASDNANANASDSDSGIEDDDSDYDDYDEDDFEATLQREYHLYVVISTDETQY